LDLTNLDNGLGLTGEVGNESETAWPAISACFVFWWLDGTLKVVLVKPKEARMSEGLDNESRKHGTGHAHVIPEKDLRLGSIFTGGPSRIGTATRGVCGRPPEPREQTAATVVNHEQTSLFLLIFSFATYVRDAGMGICVRSQPEAMSISAVAARN
jgi:hypothetical protein